MVKVMIFGGEDAFGRWLGHEGRALLTEIRVFIKKAPGSLLALLPYKDTARSLYNLEESLHQTPDLLMPRSWTTQPPELLEINFCCLQATQHVLFCYSSLKRLRTFLIIPNSHLYGTESVASLLAGTCPGPCIVLYILLCELMFLEVYL